MSRRTWLGLDPSLASFGWAVMHQEVGGQPTVRGMGVWCTKLDSKAKKMQDRARRVKELVVHLRNLVAEYRPTEAYVESPVQLGDLQGWASVHASARVRGIVDAAAVLLGFELADVDTQIVKQAVTGRRDASKEDVARILAATYRLSPSEARQLDATDALAVAHVGAHRYGGNVQVTSGIVSYRRDVEADDTLDF